LYINCYIYIEGLGLPYMDFGSSWLWSYGSCIYNYLCNQCLSPLTWVRTLAQARCTWYNIMW